MKTTIAALGTCALLLSLRGQAFATAQEPDELLYKGKKQMLFSTPLEEYWTEKNPRPHIAATSTACWRGYRAQWEIKAGYLTLVGLFVCHAEKKTMPVATVLPGKQLPLRATWFTGVLRVPMGKQLQYVHMGFHSRYEKDLMLSIKAGKVMKEVIIDNRPGSKSRATRKPEEIAAGLAPIKAEAVAKCYPKSKPPESVSLELLITADGTPSDVKVLDRIPVAQAACIQAHVVVMAKFPVTTGESTTRYRWKLR